MTEVIKKMQDVAGKAHDYTAGKALQLFGGLFMEQKGDGEWIASLGRSAFWIVFGHVMWLFHKGTTVPAEEISVFYALLGYQGVKVGKDALSETAAAWKGNAE